ncbi:hypothetical protein ACJ4V0_19660 [Phreatobacter sp. HK31-P]
MGIFENELELRYTDENVIEASRTAPSWAGTGVAPAGSRQPARAPGLEAMSPRILDTAGPMESLDGRQE